MKGDRYGSTSTTDIVVLQALSKRIHFGKYVAEVKFREDPEEYTRLADINDYDAIMQKLTNSEVNYEISLFNLIAILIPY